VECGRGRRLYALSQGVFPIDGRDGFSALPNTGVLVAVSVRRFYSPFEGVVVRE
jgi:hypothetical protein